MNNNKIKVLYDGFTNIYSVQIIKYLRDKYQWEPIFISGQNVKTIKKYLFDNNIKCNLQDSMLLRQAQFDYSDIGRSIPIDAIILNSLSKYVINHFGFMQDTTGWNFSFDERKNFYYDILEYWNTVLTRFEPDLVVFFTWPHTSSCYPLYLLCKHHFSINVLFIDPSPLFDLHYHFVGNSIEKIHEPFMDIYEGDNNLLPSDGVKEYLSKTKGDKASIPKYLNKIYEKDKKTINNYLVNLLKLSASTLIKGTGFKIGQSEYKKNRKNYKDIKSRMNNLEIYYFMWKIRKNNINLSRLYKKICVTPEYNKKYLFFAAPYQPEAVTSINAGVYEEMFLVLNILSTCIPDDWLIYYKEHPGTFLENFKGSLKRNDAIYRKLQSYNKIKIISTSENTFKLIDNSQAVATIGGTTGWEAVVRGKPCLAFGNAWYQGCKSIFTIDSLNDAKDAISKICNGYLPDFQDIERYSAAIERIAIKGIINDNFINEMKKLKDPEYELERIATMIYDGYARIYL